MEINDLDGDGFKEILLGGSNAGSREAALVVLDPRKVSSPPRAEYSDQTSIDHFPAGVEEAYVLFPRCRLCGDEARPFISKLEVLSGKVEVRVCQTDDDPGARVTYRMAKDLTLVEVQMSSRIKDLYFSRSPRGNDGGTAIEDEEKNLRSLRMIRPLSAARR
jgi:hypothetical protein